MPWGGRRGEGGNSSSGQKGKIRHLSLKVVPGNSENIRYEFRSWSNEVCLKNGQVSFLIPMMVAILTVPLHTTTDTTAKCKHLPPFIAWGAIKERESKSPHPPRIIYLT